MSNVTAITEGAYDLDDATCKKVASLIAYGFTDRQVADALLLSDEQVATAKATKEFLAALAKHTHERAQRAIDVADGWDAVEERALSNVLQAIEVNRDPRFSLLAARTANQARRRSLDTEGKAIDAGKAGNVIVLSLSRTFVEKRSVTEERAVLEIRQGSADQAQGSGGIAALPRKINDTISPAKVGEILGAAGKRPDAIMDEIFGDIFDQVGVSQQMIEGPGDGQAQENDNSPNGKVNDRSK